MATQYSNKPIVTDGLVYALDFGNPKSYVNVVFSGSTTTAEPGSTVTSLKYDLTFLGYLLTGSSTISPLPKIEDGLLKMETSGSNGGSHIEVFRDPNDPSFPSYNVTFPFIQPNTPNGTITFVAEGKSGILFSQIGSDYGNVSLSGRLTSTLTPTSYAYGSGFGPIARSYNGDFTGLNFFTLRMSSGSLDFFLNGVPISASGLSVTNDNSNNDKLFRIGTRRRSGGYGSMFTGSLGTMYVYDRPLTGDEIYRNYTIMADRYNLPKTTQSTLDENAYLFLQSAGITDPIITSSIDTFVRGLKSNNLWDKMIAIYPFVGTGSDGVNLTGSQSWNLKEPSLVTYPLSFTGSWIGSTSGSAPSGSSTNISVNGITPSQYYPSFSTESAHMSILSYDTPASSSYLMGTGMTEDLAVSTLAGDYGTPAAAYSVRKVRTAYSGALMDVRRNYDNVTSSIGYVNNGDLDTGSLLDWVIPGRNDLPGEYDGLAAAYSLRKVSASYSGDAIEVRRDWDNESGSFGFDANGDLNTVSLLTFVTGSAGTGSGFVQTWYDQSGNGRHATQVSASRQPLIVSSGSLITENGKPALSFDGSNDVLQTETFTTISQPATHFSVTRILNSGINIFDGQNIDRFSVVKQTSTQVAIFAGGALTNTGYNQSTQNIIYGLFSGSNSKLQVNNNQETSGSVGGNNLNKITIGAGGNLAYNASGSIQEYIFYTGSQETNRELLKNNINNYYNIYTGSNHGFVERWYDQSGNDRHAVQSSTSVGAQQIIVESGSILTLNSKPIAKGGVGYTVQNPTTHSNISTFTVGRGSTVFNIQSNLTRSIMWASGVPTTKYFYIEQSGNGSFANSVNPNYSIINGLPKSTSLNRGQVATEVENQSLISLNWNNINSQINVLGSNLNDYNNYDLQEILFYPSDQTVNREPIEYGINDYYNIYTQPTSSNWTTSSFTIKADSTSISGSLNNKLTSGIQSSGPLGLVTVSRTGSDSLTLARNGAATSFSVPASGALSTGLYLGAINNNGLALGNSPLNLSFASVGTGLTNNDTLNLNKLVYNLQGNLYRDPSVTAFLTAANITDSTQSIAITTLVADLKGYGIWDKMKAIYPFVGQAGVSSSFEFNLKDPNTFRGTFYGDFTFSSTGVTPNGANTFMNTGLISENDLQVNSVHLSNYFRNFTPETGVQFGVSDDDIGKFLSVFWNYPGIGLFSRFHSNSLSGIAVDNTDSGLKIMSRTLSNLTKAYHNGVVISSSTQASTGKPNKPIYLFARNSNGNLNSPSSLEQSFASIGDGLTDTEAANLYTAVQRFQTTLGRQV